MFFSNNNDIDALNTYLDKFEEYVNGDRNKLDELILNKKDSKEGKLYQRLFSIVNNLESNNKSDLGVFGEIMLTCEKMGDGYFTDRVQLSTNNPKVNYIAKTVNYLSAKLESSIGIDLNEIESVLESYSKYDFRPKIANPKGNLEKTVNFLGDVITKMLIDNKKNGLILDHDSDILLQNVEALNTSSTQQAASLEETAASVEEITANIQSTADKSNSLLDISEDTKEKSNIGKKLADDTSTAMDEINDSTTAIANAITVIDQIAFQTNILSLNAAVEAATAGEAGKGFAVVAGEVRNLAARSAEAANEIKALVEQAKVRSDEGKVIASKMTEGYTQLDETIEQTVTLVNETVKATNEQMEGMKQINNAVTELDTALQKIARIAAETNNVALQADEISKTIVSNANDKEFDGKNSIDVSKFVNKVNTTSMESLSRSNDKTTSMAKNLDIKNNEWDSF